MTDEKSKGSRDLTGLFETSPSLAPDPGGPIADSAPEMNEPAIALPAGDALPAFEADPFAAATLPEASEPAIPMPDESAPAAESATPAGDQAIENIREYSEKVEVGHPQVEAAFPFSLLIEGALTDSEREKLSELLTREDVGIREIDLEPQLAAGRVLIPRISEYAGVLIVQCLRSSRARMRLGPSDSIFQSKDAEPADQLISNHPQEDRASVHLTTHSHPAEQIVVTTDAGLPDGSAMHVLDAITASAHLKTGAIEAESSEEYQTVLEALQREIKYKAYRRGADAVVGFSVTLTPLSDPARYRLTALGSAVKRPSN